MTTMTHSLEPTRVALLRLERQVLTRVLEALDVLRDRIEARLAEPAAEAPLADYDTLTAKAIIAALDSADDDTVSAVLVYERAHKGRTTVVRACEHRVG